METVFAMRGRSFSTHNSVWPPAEKHASIQGPPGEKLRPLPHFQTFHVENQKGGLCQFLETLWGVKLTLQSLSANHQWTCSLKRNLNLSEADVSSGGFEIPEEKLILPDLTWSEGFTCRISNVIITTALFRATQSFPPPFVLNVAAVWWSFMERVPQVAH